MNPPATSSPGVSPGLCSVTFRHLPVPEVVALTAAAGLAGIEWGADVHVPVGDLAAAADTGRRTIEAGLRVASYGSYLFAEHASLDGIGPVLDTAAALGTDLVRVWCPFGVPADASEAARDGVVEVLRTWATRAAERRMTLYLEFHGGTLTATAASTRHLLEAVAADDLATAWQPAYWHAAPGAAGPGTEVDDVALLAPWLAHVHVYEWDADLTRHRLATGDHHWPAALAAARDGRPDLDRFALLEFVVDDDPAALAADAATLVRWLQPAPPGTEP